MAKLSEHGIRLSCMSPSYLHSNSTSHTWPFSAVAELIALGFLINTFAEFRIQRANQRSACSTPRAVIGALESRVGASCGHASGPPRAPQPTRSARGCGAEPRSSCASFTSGAASPSLLADNACDPGVTAKQIWIDVVNVKDELCLTFTDNGSGMTPSKLHKMLSFGFTDKSSSKSHQPIGVYGNGFKSGSMRLGKDALIFTKNGGCLSVGLLSQTYLEKIRAQAVIVPINLIVTEDSVASLNAILTHSLFSTQEELLEQFDTIPSKKGTKIIVWNIRRNKDGKPELDFETDKYDIRMPDIRPEEMRTGGKKRFPGPERTDQSVPEMDYLMMQPMCLLVAFPVTCTLAPPLSLQAYCSILYLKPRTQIILRSRKVQTKLIAKSLANIENDVYKPSFIAGNQQGHAHLHKELFTQTVIVPIVPYNQQNNILLQDRETSSRDQSGLKLRPRVRNKRVKITFGFNYKNKDHYGIMMYHKNRLIKSYEKVGCQIKSTSRGSGVGVIGVIECNFLKPAHNKQDFEYTKEYRLTLAALGLKLNDYWREKKEKKAKQKACYPEEPWVQCEECLKWRKLPSWMQPETLPDKWHCALHPDPRSRDPAWDRKRSRSLEEGKNRPGLARGLSEPANHSLGKQEEMELEDEVALDYSTRSGEEDHMAACSNKRKPGPGWKESSPEKKLCSGLEGEARPPRGAAKQEREEDGGRKRGGLRESEEEETLAVEERGTSPNTVAVKQEHGKAPPGGRSVEPQSSPTGIAPPLRKKEACKAALIPEENPESMDRVTLCQRVAQLEKEADRLRRILGTPPLPRSPLREEGHPSTDQTAELCQQLSQERELLSQGLSEAAEKLVRISTERDKYKFKVMELEQERARLQEEIEKSQQEVVLLRSPPSRAGEDIYWGKKYSSYQYHELEQLRASLDHLQLEKRELENRLRQAELCLQRCRDTREQSTSTTQTASDRYFPSTTPIERQPSPRPETGTGDPALPLPKTGDPITVQTTDRLFWPKSKSYDYLYSDGQALLKNFPAQATINFYEESDSEEEDVDDDEECETEEEESESGCHPSRTSPRKPPSGISCYN
ncbi:MORC4 protein, partial [Atractosteus spatula]|nr:MORC4 protein [Atractosteus spatula]